MSTPAQRAQAAAESIARPDRAQSEAGLETRRRRWSSSTERRSSRPGTDEILLAGVARSEVPDLGEDVDPVQDRRTRALNTSVALVAIVLTSPLALLIAIAIKLDSPGPVFYRQTRVGVDSRRLGLLGRGRRISDRGRNPSSYPGTDRRLRNAGPGRRRADVGGRPFVIYKFRTMAADAEHKTGPVWASEDDQRVTRVGRWLRRFRLDELPQFLNVLRGEMSVVGPRPERPAFVKKLRREFATYALRQRVLPGITGLAQVHRPPDQSVDDVRIKLDYDLEYLGRRSVLLDLLIMLKTLPAMVRRQ